VGYSAISGCFKGIADAVKCAPAPGISALASFHDDDPSKTLSVGLISLAGMAGPIDVAVCDFVGASVPSSAKFDVDVVDAVEPDLSPAAVVLGLTFNCDGTAATTTTATQPAPTTTSTSTTSTTLAVAATEFDVTFRLADAATLGALQVVVDYARAPGAFRGSGALTNEGGTLECTSLLGDGALAQLNDDDAGTLTMGFISLAGFTGPVDLARCTFERDGEGLLGRDAFGLSVGDASSPVGEPVEPTPQVEAARIVAR